ncbi:MAG: DNA polymerase III subunit delta' [Proteobacteria bacterium]|nr:DNA polymerase III subunit delta' [Pseudomonadota bacterium]
MNGTADIVGHERVIGRLWGALERDQLHHALLFEGPAHVGKHTVAVRLAMAANCDGPPPLPCGECSPCRQVASGAHPDVLVIEPAAERATPTISVDQIREVVRKVGYHRFSGKRRVVIVDPAEAMGPSAANALLKTLEEPPEGTGFILVATQASTLLPTILSRCQRVRFSAVHSEALTTWLNSRGIEDAGSVARLASGAPGKALELAGEGLAERRAIRDELLAVLRGPVSGIFAYTAKLCGGSRQQWMPRLEQMLDVLQDLLRDAAVIGSGAEIDLIHADERRVVEAWARLLWPTGIAAIQDSIRELRDGMEVNVMGKTLADQLLTRVQSELGVSPS